MEFNKTLTPEQQWDKVKKIIFKDEVPKNIEELIQKGFEESNSESEKWIKLVAFMKMLPERFN